MDWNILTTIKISARVFHFMKHFICNEYLAQVWIIIKNTMNSVKNSWKDTKKV